jgi:AcrR family transcriptional regulator
MSKKTNIESKILDSAYKLFLEKGYKHTTMDDIAADLGISKKTLYKYHSGKLELLSASFEVLKLKMSSKVEVILENKYISFPLKLKSTLTVVATHLAPINPELFEDVREQANDVWEDMLAYINESAYVRFQKLIKQGMDQGLVNPRINIGLIVMLYASAVQSLLDPKFISQFPDSLRKEMKLSPSEIFDQAISVIYNGILTEEARNEFANA